MANEPFYSPHRNLAPPRTERTPGEPLWMLLKNGSDRVTAELKSMPVGV